MDVKLTIEKGPASHRTVRLRNPETIIGRQKGCDIRIPSAEISRRHCILSLMNGQLMVEDLNSVNGTYVNNTRITGKQRVLPGDRLRVGPLTFSVCFDVPPVAKDLPDTAGQTEEAEPAFELIDDLPPKKRPVIRNDGNMVDPAYEPIEDLPPSADGPIPLQPDDDSLIPLQKDDDSTVDIDIDAGEPMQIPEGEDLREFLKKMDR
jgi:predicted component of type VI protein secretion system